MIRPAYYSHVWPPGLSSSGILTYVAEITDGMLGAGAAPVVVCDRQSGVGEHQGLPAFPLQPEPESVWRRLWRRVGGGGPLRHHHGVWAASIAGAVRRAQAEVGLDLFEMEESFGAAGVVQRGVEVPVVVRLHGPAFLTMRFEAPGSERGIAARVAAEDRALAATRFVSSPARHTLDQVRERCGLPRDCVSRVIPNPAPKLAEGREWRVEDSDPLRISYVGRFDRLKGADLVLRAFALARREEPRLELVFVGPGESLVDDAGRAWTRQDYLQEYLPEAAAAVHFTGAIPAEMVQDARQRSRLTVVASRFENYPYAVLEAAAQGCPIVAPDVGGIPEIITDQEHGSLFRPGDPEDLARAMLSYLGSPAQCTAHGAAAARKAATQLSCETVAAQMLEFYREVLDSQD